MYRLAPLVRYELVNGEVLVKTPDQLYALAPEAAELLDRFEHWATAVDFYDEVNELVDEGILVERTAWTSTHDAIVRVVSYLDALGDDPVDVHRRRSVASDKPFVTDRFHYAAEIVSERSGLLRCSGGDADRYLAILKSLVELYERLSSDVVFNEAIVGRQKHAAPAADIVSYEAWQLDDPSFPFGPLPSGRWATFSDPTNGNSVSVPVELTCYPDDVASQRCGSATSSGVAAHTSFEDAVLLSAYELVERDALMVHWFGGIDRPLVEIDDSLRERCREFETHGFEVAFVDLSLDVAPVILAVCHRDGNASPNLGLGLASCASAIDACHKALDELEAYLLAVLGVKTVRPATAKDIRRVSDHTIWYDDPDAYAPVLALARSDARVKLDHIASGPRSVVEMHASLQSAGLEWYVTELNRSSSQASGVQVVRSIIPGLVPIQFGYGREPLGMLRLGEPPVHGVVVDRTQSDRYATHPLA